MLDRFTVTSRDGVPISVQQSGAGPALLLVHGSSLNASASWALVNSGLSQRFTVYAMDRRGRAPSGDAQPYSITNEGDDICAVIDAIGQPLTVLAHSYGALSTVDALDRLHAVSRLILYEPPLMVTPPPPSWETVVANMERALAANDPARCSLIFFRDQIGMPPERIMQLQSSPLWPVMCQVAPTLPRESRAVNSYRVSSASLAQCQIPTTLLLGSETVGPLRDGSQFLSTAVPGCRLLILEGQGHSAMLEAPDLFVRTVTEIASRASSVHRA